METAKRRGGKKNRKIGRASRKPGHTKYNSEKRWEKNKEKRKIKQAKIEAKIKEKKKKKATKE